MWQGMDAKMAMKVWHWPFLAQPSPLPEMLIGRRRSNIWNGRWRAGPRRRICRPSTRARSSITTPRSPIRCVSTRTARITAPGAWATDLNNDKADRKAGKKIDCPLLALWGARGIPSETGGPLTIWRTWAPKATGQPIDSGHFLAEENPDATAAALLEFFTTS